MKATLVLLSITLLISCSLVEGSHNDDDDYYNSPRPSSNSATNPNCSWGSWGAWGNCSQNCDNGYQRRYKSCICNVSGRNTSSEASQCYTRNNRYQPYEDRNCNQQACCSYSWGNWTSCSAPCGGGSQIRSQICNCKPRFNTTSSSSSNSKDYYYYNSGCSGSAVTQTRVCNNMSCCDWGNWTNWSSCEGSGTNRCGSYNSKQYRYRDCACIPGYEQQVPVPTPNPTPSSKTPPSKYGKYKRDLSTNKSSKTPQPSSPPPPSRPADVCVNGVREWQDQPCTGDGCCRWGEWTETQQCTQLCGGGILVRRKPCLCPVNVTGDSDNVEYEELEEGACESLGPQPFNILPCNTHPCCELTFACEASACSDNDTLEAERICTCDGLSPEETNSSYCDNIQPTQCQACSEDCCDFAQWSEWSICSAPCGGGTQWRQQFCADCLLGDDSCNCTSGRIETQDCNLPQCCNYTDRYTEPTECNKDCGGGLSFQTQICVCLLGEGSVPRDVEVSYCLHQGPPDVIVSECNNESCCDWNEWSDWGNCTKNCNAGEQKRTRNCSCADLDPNAIFPNHLCGNESEAVETRVCNNRSCCSYGNYSSWSSCSAQCGGGYQYRYQVCSCLPETNTTSRVPTPTPTPTKSYGKYKREASSNDNDDDTYYYYDDYPSTKGSKSPSSSSPPPAVNTCYDAQSQRQEQRCNTQACASSSKKSGKKYY